MEKDMKRSILDVWQSSEYASEFKDWIHQRGFTKIESESVDNKRSTTTEYALDIGTILLIDRL